MKIMVNGRLKRSKPLERRGSPERTAMKHRHAVGDRVRCINHDHKQYGQRGTIDAILPYTFVAPAYYVLWDGATKTVAVSERSLELCIELTEDGGIDQNGSEKANRPP